MDDEYDEDYICPNCNGSGEGMHDGTKCMYCKGTGTHPKYEPDPVEDYNDYREDR